MYYVVTRISNKGSYKSSLIRLFSFYIIKILWQLLLLNLTRLLKTEIGPDFVKNVNNQTKGMVKALERLLGWI